MQATPAIWQISAGPSDRSYADVFFSYGVGVNNHRLQGGGFKGCQLEIDHVVHRYPFLGIDVLLDHVIRDRARRDRQITASPEMFPPEGLTQVRKLLKEHPRTDALQPLDDCADVLIRAIRHKHVDVLACHFSRQNRQLVLHRDLSDQIAHTNGHLPSQHALPILRDPDQVDFEIGFRVRSVSIPPHATTLPRSSLRLKARGFDHPRRGH